MTVEVIREITRNRGAQVLVRRGDEFFVVSTIPGETLVFHANAQGKPTSMREVQRASGGSGWTREDAITVLENMTDEDFEQAREEA